MPSPEKTILITCGDPAGIGPEVAMRALAELAPTGDTAVLLVGPREVWESAAQRAGAKLPPRIGFAHIEAAGDIEPGTPSAAAARTAYAALERACEMLGSGKAHALVTMPVSKAAMLSAGLDFRGHTEYLAGRFGSKVVMMLAAGPMRYFLATTHLAMRDVPDALTTEGVLRTLERAHASLKILLEKDDPAIALCALNPHASDDGAFGDEEARVLEPAVRAAREAGIDAAGPLPADTVARLMNEGAFDGAAACFHDQALIALKAAHPGRGVNVTFGLPFVRTSPLHGVAYDAARSGRPDHASALEALRSACRLLG
jgi:4-hydroxythreonine-4-phosphate dehydrogenase